MKICSNCKEEKEFSEFHKKAKSKDGYREVCKECRKPESKEYYEKNIDSINNKLKEYRKTNKGYLETNRRYRELNTDFVKSLKTEWSKSESGRESKKKYYQNNSEKVKEKVRKYNEDNKESILIKRKNKRQTEEYKLYMKEYLYIHKERNPHIYAWRCVLTNTLKRFNKNKEGKTIELLGYSALELKIHLESLFKEGMSWENYGEWHIDHIKPVSLFNKETPMSIVNALENLQPLWASENLSKSNKY